MAGPRVNFLVSRFQNAFFMELAQVIVEELREIGVDARIVSSPTDADDNDIFVLLPAHEYITLEGGSHLDDERLAQRTIGLTAEQPGTGHFDTNLELARRLGAVFDFSQHACEAYRQDGVEARHFRFGWTRSWDRFDEEAPRLGPQLLFLGSFTERRAKQLARLGRSLWQYDSRIVMSDNSRPNHESSASFITGNEKRALLQGTELLINVHQTDEPYFEWLRASEAMLCGTIVVTEPSAYMEPYVDGIHLVVRSAAAMPTTIDDLLHDEARRRELRRAAHAELRSHPLRLAVEELLEVARGLQGGPALTRMTVGPRQVAPFGQHRRSATSNERREADVVRQAIREIRLDLMDVKRQLQAARRGEPQGPVSIADLTTRSAAATIAAAPPRVSIVLALFNHAQYVTDALDSVANGGFADLEVIVVNDGSTDASAAVVGDWMVANPDVRTLLVDLPVNRGLPHARNTAIEVATGEYCFILDADNTVLPAGITQLVAALDADPHAAFAYGVLQKFGSAGPLGLMGVFPWEPARLSSGNYIDAMSLIRRAVLTELGGFTTDRRLYGWEDYDLWCRIAESGGYGVHIPRPVARYRTALSSMVSLSNLSHDSAFDALYEHAPRLMDGSLPAVAASKLRAGEAVAEA